MFLGSSKLLPCLLLTLIPLLFKAQDVLSQNGDESDLYAETKQVNQFFRRFNCEESTSGDRYYPGDREYHDTKMRRKYLEMLFDEQNPYLTSDIKDDFIKDVTRPSSPAFLNFHGGNWFAEVRANFMYKGKEEKAILFLKIQEQAVGSKWVIDGVYLAAFEQLFEPDTASADSFLHPMSHELDFMNLGKLFRNRQRFGDFIAADRHPDHLTKFISEMQSGKLKYKSVEEVRFHFLQIEGWYFEIAQLTRPGHNKGWLISKITRIPDDKKNILVDYIYNNYQ